MSPSRVSTRRGGRGRRFEYAVGSSSAEVRSSTPSPLNRSNASSKMPRAGMGTLKFARRALVVALAAACTGSTGTSESRLISLPVPQASSPTDLEPATQREQARILATYGGEDDNARLHAMIEKTVERLVAAAERPALTS